MLLRECGGPGGAVVSSLGGKKSGISYCRAAAEIKNSPYSPVAEPRITHRAPESHGASIPKTPRRVTRCEATLYSSDGLFSSERRQEVTLATINERDRKGSTHPARFRKD